MRLLWVDVRQWCLILLVVATVVTEDSDEEKSDTVFVPSAFVPPKLSSKPLFFDYFPTTDEIGKRWIPSTAKKEGVDSEIAKYNGKWEIGPSSEVSIEGDYGLIVRTKARHHAIAAKLDEPFSFADKPLVVQYEVRYEEGQECGGGYLKLLSVGAEKNLAAVQDKTPYTIMFGPDKCGATGKVHLIFRYKNPKNNSIDEYHAKQPSNIGSTYWDDHQTHLYTLVVKPDGTFSVSVDQKEIMSGNMLNDLQPSLQPPKQIADPTDKKPADWDDRAEIEDESAVKPDDWDESQPSEVVDENAVKPSDWLENEPELIPDPEASKPSDWDDEMDGDWEPPMIDNPACKSVSGCGQWKKPLIPNPLYKGKWVRPKIANPAYRGVWAPRQIENPHFFEPKPFEGLATITAIGIELWTMSQNIIFDNILVCESEDLAAEIAKQTYTVRRAEDARLASSQGKGAGIVQGIVDAANERPWLWVVYVLCILIPIILIGVCCFGRKSNADYAAERKKTDAPEIDDEVPNLVDDEEDEKDLEEAEIEEAERVSEGKPSPHGTPKAEKEAEKVVELEDLEGSNSEPDIVNVEADEAGPSGAKKSPTVTKRRVRRQD
ncbi:hypothetical protein V3C99_000531 [Haemonchus contortus]|uniref:Calnexin n=1 Tax=Haemonchus contortus TaxID=6289 RepID=A0A7I4YEQ5_HAECO